MYDGTLGVQMKLRDRLMILLGMPSVNYKGIMLLINTYWSSVDYANLGYTYFFDNKNDHFLFHDHKSILRFLAIGNTSGSD